MKTTHTIILVLLLVPLTIHRAEGSGSVLTTKAEQERIDVFIDGSLFTSYRTPSDWKFPYLWPVIGPLSGESITIEQGIGHPHHRSLYFACDQVNGANYWQEGLERGRIISRGARVVETGKRVVIEDTCDWVCPGQPSPIKDHRRVIITAPTECIRVLEFEFDFEFRVDTTILNSNHALFSAEVIPEIAVHGGGQLTNSEGGQQEEGTFGVPCDWCDYSGNLNGHWEGIRIYQHPGNPGYPWPFFTRNYGFVSPTPMYWLPEEGLHYKAGEKVSLKFLVVVHAGKPHEQSLNEIYHTWRGE